MHAVFDLRVREPVTFVQTTLRHSRKDCLLSLEGDLSRFDAHLVSGASSEPSELLARNTIAPVLDFVILPITAATLDTVCQQVLPQVGLKHRVVHVQVASEGCLVFGAYDHFHRESVWIAVGIGEACITTLLDNGVVGWYQRRELATTPPA